MLIHTDAHPEELPTEKQNTISKVGFYLQLVEVCLDSLADPGGRTWRAPPKGPNSFVLTYKFYEM